MGLIGSICKIGAKAFNYGKRALKIAPDFILGESAEIVGKGMRSAKGSIFTKAKAGAKALEKHVAKQAVKGNFFKRLFKGVVSLPSAFKKNIGQGIKVAARLGKGKGWGIWKGISKTVSKKMPLIGSLLTIAFEVPNIYKAFKDGGIEAGIKEIGGASVELGCMAGGAAIGSAICPGVGTVVGGIVGSLVGMFLRGKTYTEKQEEALAQNQEQESQQTPVIDGMTPEEIQKYQKLLAEQQKAQEQQTPTENVQPTVEQPVTQQPVAPTITDPTAEQPVIQQPVTSTITNPTAEQPVTQQPVTSTIAAPTISTPTTGLTDFTTAYSGINPSFGITGGFGANYPLYGGTTPSLYGSFGSLTNPIAANPYTNTNPFNFDSNLYSQYPSNYKFVYYA